MEHLRRAFRIETPRYRSQVRATVVGEIGDMLGARAWFQQGSM